VASLSDLGCLRCVNITSLGFIRLLRRKSRTIQNGTRETDGQANHCFFDGHVEPINPQEIYNNRSYYEPLTESE